MENFSSKGTCKLMFCVVDHSHPLASNTSRIGKLRVISFKQVDESVTNLIPEMLSF